MDFILIQFLTGLSNASALFLIASGLTVIFGVTRIVNFAHGSFYMLGAYLTWTITRALWDWGGREPALFILAILLAALAVGAIGALTEIALLRRIYRAPELFQLLATFGVVLMIQDLALAVWGPEDLPLPRPPWLRRSDRDATDAEFLERTTPLRRALMGDYARPAVPFAGGFPAIPFEENGN